MLFAVKTIAIPGIPCQDMRSRCLEFVLIFGFMCHFIDHVSSFFFFFSPSAISLVQAHRLNVLSGYSAVTRYPGTRVQLIIKRYAVKGLRNVSLDLQTGLRG